MIIFLFFFHALASHEEAVRALNHSVSLFQEKKYLEGASAAFEAIEQDLEIRAQAYPWIATHLIYAGMHHSASYFYIRTLQSGDKKAIEAGTLWLRWWFDIRATDFVLF
jgi:hypothetical protein